MSKKEAALSGIDFGLSSTSVIFRRPVAVTSNIEQ
jgi:hypothetical protein